MIRRNRNRKRSLPARALDPAEEAALIALFRAIREALHAETAVPEGHRLH